MLARTPKQAKKLESKHLLADRCIKIIRMRNNWCGYMGPEYLETKSSNKLMVL